MTLDLDNKSITINAFQCRLWLTVRAFGGSLTVALDPDEAEQFGLAAYRMARKIRRGQ